MVQINIELRMEPLKDVQPSFIGTNYIKFWSLHELLISAGQYAGSWGTRGGSKCGAIAPHSWVYYVRIMQFFTRNESLHPYFCLKIRISLRFTPLCKILEFTPPFSKKVNRKVQGVPQSQTAANPRQQEEEKNDKN